MRGALRLTGGEWRGRKLPPPLSPQTRPSTGRVREALFSRLGGVEGLRCLDLFAGSGALGLEALSRGAAEVVLIERNRPAAARIRRAAELMLNGNDNPPPIKDGGGVDSYRKEIPSPHL